MGKFLSKLDVEQIEDQGEEGRGTWKVISPLSYEADSGINYVVPVGFVTDFASVPRVPVIFDLVGDRGNEAATLHDWLYSIDPITKAHPVPTRAMADALLHEAALAQGCPEWVAEALFIGVRIGGASHWS